MDRLELMSTSDYRAVDQRRERKHDMLPPLMLDHARVLLIDPSEKGALPLYTSLIAGGLRQAGLKPMILASRRLIAPELAQSWPILRRLPSARWPRPPGSPAPSRIGQAIVWLACAIIVLWTALALRPRIIHFQHPLHPRLDPLLVRLLTPIAPVVWTAHDVLPHDPSTNANARARRLYKSVQAVLVHNRPAADQVGEIAGVRPIVIHHPVRPLDRVPDRTVARARLGLEQTERVAAAVGFIRAYKGYDLLAAVWDLLGTRAPLLLLMGELVDPSEAEVIARLQAHSRTDVRLGYACDADVVAALAAADVVLLPHERGSDSGTLHMARAVGVPVLSSDHPQLAAVVRETKSGRVLPRKAACWAEALLAPPPSAPARPPGLGAVGAEHAAAYEGSYTIWRRHRSLR